MSAWHEPQCFPSSPVFVPSPPGQSAQNEDDGVLMSIVYESKRERSFLIIIDIPSWTEIYRAYLPCAVPFVSQGECAWSASSS